MPSGYVTRKSGLCSVCGKRFVFETKTRYQRLTCSVECSRILQKETVKNGGVHKYEYEPSPEEIAEKAAAIKARNLQRMRDEVVGWANREMKVN